MYHHILVPVENSSTDNVILSHIERLARFTGAKVTVIHVAEGFVARNQERMNLNDSEEILEDRAYLERIEKQLQDKGFVAQSILAKGEPADEIVRVAEESGCDLIAMATHGHRFVKDLFLGSVASEVRHRTSIPVLLIRSPFGSEASGDLTR